MLNYPGSSWLDMLRPKPSSQPAAASLPQAVGGLLGQSVLSILDQAERTVTGANALWLGSTGSEADPPVAAVVFRVVGAAR